MTVIELMAANELMTVIKLMAAIELMTVIQVQRLAAFGLAIQPLLEQCRPLTERLPESDKTEAATFILRPPFGRGIESQIA